MICQSCGSKNVRLNMYEQKQCVECRATGDKLKTIVCPCGSYYGVHICPALLQVERPIDEIMECIR